MTRPILAETCDMALSFLATRPDIVPTVIAVRNNEITHVRLLPRPVDPLNPHRDLREMFDEMEIDSYAFVATTFIPWRDGNKAPDTVTILTADKDSSFTHTYRIMRDRHGTPTNLTLQENGPGVLSLGMLEHLLDKPN